MNMSFEDTVVLINRVGLSWAQRETLRIALENFDSMLRNEGLGDDQHGKAMVGLYRARIQEIRSLLGL